MVFSTGIGPSSTTKIFSLTKIFFLQPKFFDVPYGAGSNPVAYQLFWKLREQMVREMLEVDPRSELQGVKDKINIININRSVV